MTEPTFFCGYCQKHKYLSTQVKPRGCKPLCRACYTKAKANTAQSVAV